MKPILLIAMVFGGMTGVFLNVFFGVGLRAPAAPGSIIAVYAQCAPDSYLGVTIAVFGSTGRHASLIAAFLLKVFKDDSAEDDLRCGHR